MQVMITFSLQSGSNGNAIYVEANGARLLFDAGLTGSTAQRRMAVHGKSMADVDAVIISHDHTDHIRYAGVYQRKFGLPLFMTKRTQAATWWDLGTLNDVRHFEAGETLSFGHVRVHSIPTPHDAADGVVFVVECDGKRLGILTDLGHPFAGLRDIVASLDAMYIEANYDPFLLERGGYPPALKARIRGEGGHLSNDEAAGLVGECARDRATWVAVAHLSQDNNTPELAVGAMRAAFGSTRSVFHASRARASEMWEV